MYKLMSDVVFGIEIEIFSPDSGRMGTAMARQGYSSHSAEPPGRNGPKRRLCGCDKMPARLRSPHTIRHHGKQQNLNDFC